jgi:hypothetical protein
MNTIVVNKNIMKISKLLFFSLSYTIPFIAFAQKLNSKNYTMVLNKMAYCKQMNVYTFKTDTLLKCIEAKEKKSLTQTDRIASIVYFDIKGNLKYEAKVGGIAGLKPSKEFIQMEKELILVGTLSNEKSNEIKVVSKDAIANKKFNPKGVEIYFYDEPNFKGKQLMINAEGDFDLVAARPVWNNAISSIQVPDGYFITLYDTNPNAEGDLATYVEIGNKNNKAFTIANFKKLPTLNYVTADGPDHSNSKVKIINFDKKTSYVVVAKY